MRLSKIALIAAVLAPQSAFPEPACQQWAYDAVTVRAAVRAERAGQWIGEAERALTDIGLPSKWLYLMLEESGGKMQVCSSVGACGPWQLTQATARRYGCTDRTDPYTATLAAGRYIQHLLEVFDGDERAVVMAYNMGGANLRKHGPTRAAKSLADLVLCAFVADPLNLQQEEL
jgi:soluble lytic murein transglycosylase-like protein